MAERTFSADRKDPYVADPEIKKEATQIVKSVAEFLENF